MYADVALNFGENGGVSCGGPVETNCWALVGANPGIGFTGYLTYFFPTGTTVTAGDLKILEPGTSAMSDGLRFTNAAGDTAGNVADRMFVYSDQLDGIDAVADTGFPGNFYSSGNTLTVTETGPPPGCGGPYSDSSNGLCYSPTVGQPGAGIAVQRHYNFVSDTPEGGVPLELALGPCGVLLCGILLRKRLVLN
jgi:hypothetical protein